MKPKEFVEKWNRFFRNLCGGHRVSLQLAAKELCDNMPPKFTSDYDEMYQLEASQAKVLLTVWIEKTRVSQGKITKYQQVPNPPFYNDGN